MFEEKQRNFARGLVITVFAILAVIILVVAIRVMFEHIDEKGNIKDDDECLTEEAQDLMRRSGAKIPSAAKCKKK
ncbi:hypothetical protein IKX12_03210 [Candidatus Saccharibacteria bacterium]|nr:hypothetical protein [Candidatus Saccharibacteria bacterium]